MSETKKQELKQSMKALITTFYGVQKERIMAYSRTMSMRYDKLKCNECKHVTWLKDEPEAKRNPSVKSEPVICRNPFQESEPWNDRTPFCSSEPLRIRNPGNRSDLCPKCGEKMVLIQHIPPMKLSELEETLKKLEDVEAYLQNQFASVIEEEDIWHAFFVNVKGIGHTLALGLVSQIDISKAKYPSSLWKYAGYGDIDKEKNEAKRRKVGESFPHNAFLKMTCWKVGQSFIKQKASGSFYRRMYDEFKVAEKQKHPEIVKIQTGVTKVGKPKYKQLYTKGHIHNRAIRKTIKLFLSHLWVQWRQLEDLEVVQPYGVGKGHNYISWESDKGKEEKQCLKKKKKH